MRKAILGSTAAVIAMAGYGGAISTDVGIRAAGAAEHATYASKAAFCRSNDAIDRAVSTVTSTAGLLATLKAHRQDLTTMLANAPSGSVGNVAKQLIDAAEAALAANNPNALTNLPSGGPVDTYCGVDGHGQKLPSYFGKGTKTAYCSSFLPIYEGVGSATSAAGVVSVFTTHKAQISQLASGVSNVPNSVKAAATKMAATSKKIVSSQNVSLVQGLARSAFTLALYCGQNT